MITRDDAQELKCYMR